MFDDALFKETGQVRPLDADFSIDAPYDQYRVVTWQPGMVNDVANEAGVRGSSNRDLPSFFMFLVNTSTGAVVAPAFLFLSKRCLMRFNNERVANTNHAYAHDLRSYFQFLAMWGRAWNEADQLLFEEYVQDMATEAFSDDQPLQLAQATIARRVGTVRKFYEDARARGLTDIKFDTSSARLVGRTPTTLIRPIPPETLGELLALLGPRPTKRLPGQSSRLWIAAQLALIAGLRRMEVCHVRLEFIMAIKADPERPLIEHPLLLTRVKGRKKTSRTVLLPNWLIVELQAYAIGERRELIEGLDPAVVAQTLLVTAGRGGRPGRQISPATLGRAFRAVTASASLNRQLPAFRFGTGASQQPHTFHDLRHTCACLHYHSFRDVVDDPWAEVQIRLGHALVETTRKVYLLHVHEFIPPADTIAQEFVRRMVMS